MSNQTICMLFAGAHALLASICATGQNRFGIVGNCLISLMWAVRSGAFIISEAIDRQRPANTTPMAGHNPVPEERIIK